MHRFAQTQILEIEVGVAALKSLSAALKESVNYLIEIPS